MKLLFLHRKENEVAFIQSIHTAAGYFYRYTAIVMQIDYQEYGPSPALQPFVECYWLQYAQAEAHQQSPVQQCMPSGMLEMIVHLDENVCQVWHQARWHPLPRAFFVGLYRDTVHWKSVGTSRKFGIRLKPESALRLFQVPAACLFNDFTDLETFLGKKINRFSDQLYGKLAIQEVIWRTEAFLLARLAQPSPGQTYLSEATRLIRQSKGSLSVETLSARLSVSKRQLQRSFKEVLGTTPKTYLRIIRFRNACQYAQQTATGSCWLDATYQFGYADQAHLIRDFKDFTGTVPTILLANEQQYFRRPGGSIYQAAG